MIQQLQYSFLQDAYLFENILQDMTKELWAWSSWTIRKNLKLKETKDLPPNWKKNIKYHLTPIQQRQFYMKLKRLKSLNQILQNTYTICKEFKKIAENLDKDKNAYLEIILQDNETIQHLCCMIFDNKITNSPTWWT